MMVGLGAGELILTGEVHDGRVSLSGRWVFFFSSSFFLGCSRLSPRNLFFSSSSSSWVKARKEENGK
jgi:hypothetical protein